MYKRAMLTVDANQKMPVARAITVMEWDRIDVHTHLQGTPLTVCTGEGTNCRLPEKMQGLARKAFEVSAKGCAPEVERGKLCDVLKPMAGEEGEVDKPTLASVASALAERAIDDFAAEFRDALLRKLNDRRDCVLQEVLESLMG